MSFTLLCKTLQVLDASEDLLEAVRNTIVILLFSLHSTLVLIGWKWILAVLTSIAVAFAAALPFSPSILNDLKY
ncbi:hypothetical protein B0H14DRAFT_3489173 [Mycena olivaceomarginata]|nr:hypothetical protein B0H14DRAFT_3489173 [Mycena olivaceomarginata]